MQNVKSKSKRSLSWLLVLSMILSLCAMPAGAALADAPDLEIGTLAELQAFAAAVDGGENYDGKTVVLTADIDASGVVWNSIGEKADNKSFRGTFDGQGHTVTFAIKSAAGYNALFCYNFGTIKNVKVAGSIETTEKTATYNGAICALNKASGVVDSCINEASCTYTANYSSGIAGQNAGKVVNCINRGSITDPFMMCGAITCGGTITNCLNVGQLDGKATNLSYAGKLDNSYFLDTTTSKNQPRTFGTAKTEVELKDPAFAATLGEAFAADPNGGFPMLAWELAGSSEKPHEHSYGAWAADDDKTHSRSCDCGEKQTEPHRWADGKCTVCGAKDPTPVVIPVCSVSMTLGYANASFKVPSGTELNITWKFVNDANDVPKGWQMLVNGMEPVNGAIPENAEGITGSVPSGMAIFTTGKPDSLSVKPTDADCENGLKKELGYTELTKEQLKFELKFVDIVTKEEIGTYGDGYTASQKYGEFTISATGNPAIRNYVTKNFNGYRIYMGTYGNVDRQVKTVHVGADGVIEKSVTMFVEVNHSTQSDKHVQPVKFVCDDKTVLETTVPLKNAYVNSYTPIELDMTKAAAELKEIGYELDMTKTYTVTCNDFTHDPAVSVIEVTKCAHEHSYTVVVTAPTCTERGYTTHTCACGESYVDSYVDALGHKYNSVGVCTACGAKDPEYKNVFSDVGDYYATDAIIWASYNKITYGVAEGLFAPDESCTRAQIISMLYRAAGEPKVESTENPFTDVHEGDYFYDAVLWAVKKGITYGTSADKFSPHDNCTRAEIVSFIYRAAGEPKVTANASFTDVGADAFYANAVAWAVENGITYGTSTDKFSPYDTCTRAQAVTFLYRCCVK